MLTYATSTITEPIDSVNEADKGLDWLKQNVDYSIYACTNPWRNEQILAYQIINGQRDATQYEYITKAYGIEFPSQLTHIPLVKTYLDELLGEERMLPISHKITVRDNDSIDLIRKNKIDSIIDQIGQKIQDTVKSGMRSALNGGTTPMDPLTQDHLKEVMDYHKYSWKDLKVIGAERALHHLKERCDLMRKKNMMFRDLTITGTCYYRCNILERGRDPEVLVCNPLNIYFMSSDENYYLKDAERCVYKEYLTVSEVLNRYAHLMSPEEIEAVQQRNQNIMFSGMSIYDTYFTNTLSSKYDSSNNYYSPFNLIEVCHVEWLSNTKIAMEGDTEINEATQRQMVEDGQDTKIKYRFRMDRYEGIRIGQTIHLNMGKSKNIVRPMDNPWKCSLTFNGILFNKRNSKPYSLVMATKDLQDKYDILNYYLENHIALSGTKGTRVVLENIPLLFGSDITQRLKKFLYYKKMGLEIVSVSQDGAGEFNNYGTYDDTISQSISVIIQMMEYIERIASRITGVAPQRVGMVQKNELVGNTEVAVNQSTLTTKPLFAAHGDFVKELLSDVVNTAKYSWKDSNKKKYVLGDVIGDVFTLDVDNFSETDYDIIYSDSGVEAKQIEELKQLAGAMIQSQLIDLETVVDIATIDSLTELRKKLKVNIQDNSTKKMAEANQQLEQYKTQLEQLTKTLQQFQQKDLDYKKQMLDVEDRKNTKELEIKGNQQQNRALTDQQKVDLDKQRVLLEQEQLVFNKNSEKVRQA